MSASTMSVVGTVGVVEIVLLIRGRWLDDDGRVIDRSELNAAALSCLPWPMSSRGRLVRTD
jgi:hypothetical protein